jgi:hypothetical protein
MAKELVCPLPKAPYTFACDALGFRERLVNRTGTCRDAGSRSRIGAIAGATSSKPSDKLRANVSAQLAECVLWPKAVNARYCSAEVRASDLDPYQLLLRVAAVATSMRQLLLKRVLLMRWARSVEAAIFFKLPWASSVEAVIFFKLPKDSLPLFAFPPSFHT